MSVYDTIVTLCLLFTWTLLGVVTSSALHISNPIMTNILTNPAALQNYNYVNSWIGAMVFIYIFLYVGLNIASLARAAYLRTTFTDYALAWMASWLIIFITFYMSNIFSSVFNSPVFMYGVGTWAYGIALIKEAPTINAIILGFYSVIILSRIRRGDVPDAPGFMQP